MIFFKIEDDMHAELMDGEFNTFNLALDKLIKLAKIPWNKEPNKCPCVSWSTCERRYHIVEYNKNKFSWDEISRKDVLTISAEGVIWEKKILSKFNLDQE